MNEIKIVGSNFIVVAFTSPLPYCESNIEERFIIQKYVEIYVCAADPSGRAF